VGRNRKAWRVSPRICVRATSLNLSGGDTESCQPRAPSRSMSPRWGLRPNWPTMALNGANRTGCVSSSVPELASIVPPTTLMLRGNPASDSTRCPILGGTSPGTKNGSDFTSQQSAMSLLVSCQQSAMSPFTVNKALCPPLFVLIEEAIDLSLRAVLTTLSPFG
jgi:hypothetical protein